MPLVALPLLALLAGDQAVAFSVSVPKAVFRLAELQVEFLFTDIFSLALQGGIGEPAFDRVGAKTISSMMWETGLQTRFYFTGTSSDGGTFFAPASQYMRTIDSGIGLTVQALGVGGIFGYKLAWEGGAFLDFSGGAGWGYYRADGAEGQGGVGSSVYPFLNVNFGWAI